MCDAGTFEVQTRATAARQARKSQHTSGNWLRSLATIASVPVGEWEGAMTRIVAELLLLLAAAVLTYPW